MQLVRVSLGFAPGRNPECIQTYICILHSTMLMSHSLGSFPRVKWMLMEELSIEPNTLSSGGNTEQLLTVTG